MIRKILLLVALVVAVSAEAQIDTVLFESLKNKFSFEEEYLLLSNEPEGFEGWNFQKCYAIKEDASDPSSDVWVQVGSNMNDGHITTAPLSELSGNARVTLYLYARDDDMTFHAWEMIDDDYADWHGSCELSDGNVDKWFRIPSMLFKGGTSNSKIRFYATNKSGDLDGKRFRIANILVCDIGDNIFYESFDNNNGVGGNDGEFSEDSEVTPSVDNPSSTLKNVFAGSKCLLLSTANSLYTTPVLPTTTYGQAILTFKAAGTSWADDHEITLSATGATIGTTSVNATEGEWEEFSVDLVSMTSDVKVTIGSMSCFIDEIRICEKDPVNLTMSQTDASNSDLSAMAVGTVANVSLTRTLTAGIWNTLCLPFHFDNTMLAGENHILRLTSVTDGCFNFTEDDVVPAGEPFLLQVSSTTANPTFNNVTIRTTSPGTKMFGDYGLQGIFFTTDLETDNSNAFLGTDGSLYYPAAGTNTMNGLRAYFVKPTSAPARVSFSFFEPAAIREVHREAVAHEYNLWGQRVTSSRRGIIVRNGKKVYRQ